MMRKNRRILMTSDKHRADYISSILRALLVVNILVFVLAATWMFIASNARDVYIFGIISCSCLIASVGCQLLIRWQRLGLYLTVGAYLGDSFILSFCFSPWLITLCESCGDYIPFMITSVILLVLIVLLFMIKDAETGKNCWSQMSNGADIQHFRHIYQLTSVLLLVTVGLILYLPAAKPIETFNQKIEAPILAYREISYSLLDSANVTLDELVLIEPIIDSIPGNLQMKYNKRMLALKHLLLSGLMTQEHDAKDIINISRVHVGEFSESQQRILDWYLGLPNEVQQRWIDCPPVSNLTDFKRILTETVEK